MKKIKKKLNAQQLVIKELLKKNGGPTKVAKKMADITDKEFIKQNVDYWVNNSGVPLKFVYIVADLFKVSPHALNYLGMQKAGIATDKTWVELVKACKLTEKTEEQILELKTPK